MLEQIKFSYKESDNQADLFTPQHTRFVCVIKYNGKQYTFDYQCNIRHFEPYLANCMACLLQDAETLDYNDLSSWLCEFGYNQDAESLRKGIKAYKQCEKTKKALARLFSDEELSELWEELENEM